MLSIMSFARHYPSSLTVNIINAHIIRLIIMLLQSFNFFYLFFGCSQQLMTIKNTNTRIFISGFIIRIREINHLHC